MTQGRANVVVMHLPRLPRVPLVYKHAALVSKAAEWGREATPPSIGLMNQPKVGCTC